MKKQISILILALLSMQLLSARGYVRYFYSRFKVREAVITEEEYLQSRLNFNQYNEICDTILDPYLKDKVDEAIFSALSTREKQELISGDAVIDRISTLPTGDFLTVLWRINWAEPVFIDSKLNVHFSGINAGVASICSKDGIFVGCTDFDCDNIASLTFFRRDRGNSCGIKPFAQYRNNQWELYPSDNNDGYLLFWCNGALLCKGIQHGENFGQVIYLKLTLEKEKKLHRIDLR